MMLSPFALGFCFRCRGGFMSFGGTQGARLVYWALPVFLATLNPLCAVGAFLGLLIPHGKYAGSYSHKNAVAMALIGFARMLLILAPLALENPLVLAVAPIGLLSGVAHFVSWRYLHGKDSCLYYKDQVFAKGGSEWREVIDGFVYGIGIVVSLAI